MCGRAVVSNATKHEQAEGDSDKQKAICPADMSWQRPMTAAGDEEGRMAGPQCLRSRAALVYWSISRSRRSMSITHDLGTESGTLRGLRIIPISYLLTRSLCFPELSKLCSRCIE